MDGVSRRLGVDVIMDELSIHPHCPHGPMLLFERDVPGGGRRQFFACSACRDRKECNFFNWADETITDSKKKAWEARRQKLLPKVNPEEMYQRLQQVLQAPQSKRLYCHTCFKLLCKEEAKMHAQHDIKASLSDDILSKPSELLKALQSSTGEAQYHFTQQTTNVIVSFLENLGIEKVICIGSPRIHEAIQNLTSKSMKSLLLDIDWRYHLFYKPSQFCWYNMFNNYFFLGDEARNTFVNFLTDIDGSKVAVFTDPPFGGRSEPLAYTFKQILSTHSQINPLCSRKPALFWVFPYFMEPQLTNSLPELQMLDYKVDYDNHKHFKKGSKGCKVGSPVRIFTTAPPELVPLPAQEGYRFCNDCKRWVAAENRHCKFCNACTSKDGRTYVHCKICRRCVKPTWKHCNVCKRCCLATHKCGAPRPMTGCYICGAEDHKKKDCSQVQSKKLKRHISEDGLEIIPAKKLRKKQNRRKLFKKKKTQ